MCQRNTATCPTTRDKRLFLAVDGISGFTWNHLTSEQIAAAIEAVNLPVTWAQTPQDDQDSAACRVPVPLTNGTIEMVYPAPNGTLRVWVGDSPMHLAVDAALGSAHKAAAITTRIVAILGLPDEAVSDAAA